MTDKMPDEIYAVDEDALENHRKWMVSAKHSNYVRKDIHEKAVKERDALKDRIAEYGDDNAMARTLSYIRNYTGVEEKPMMYELPDIVRGIVDERDALKAENERLLGRFKAIQELNEGSKTCVICGVEGSHKVVCPVYIAEKALQGGE